MAWLHATPKRNNKNSDAQPRINTLDKNDPSRELPEINQYLATCFQLAGICLDNGMGVSSLTWNELNSFIRISAYPLSGWESEQIIMMSRDYCRMLHKATDYACPSPYNLAANDEDAKKTNRSIINDRFLAMLSSME